MAIWSRGRFLQWYICYKICYFQLKPGGRATESDPRDKRDIYYEKKIELKKFSATQDSVIQQNWKILKKAISNLFIFGFQKKVQGY